MYYAQVKERKLKIPMEQRSALLQLVPDEDVYPELPSNAQFMLASEEAMATGNLYIKRPNMRDYDDFKEFDICKGMHSIMLDELRALERIAQNPHPNIIRYHGCRVRRGRITGIVLDRYEKNLDQYIQRVGPLVDKAPFMDALEDAVRHLHSLGLAHNDINPSNIMVNDAGMPVLVDFGSCKWIGVRLGPSGGTPGFAENDGEFDTSEASHDPFGLVKIREWLDNPVPMGRDDPGPKDNQAPMDKPVPLDNPAPVEDPVLMT